MKPWRILRDEMHGRAEARRGSGVEINLELNYRLRKSEETLKRFIEPHEIEDVNARLRDMQSLMTPDQGREMAARAAEIKAEFAESLGSLNPRVSAVLLRTAVDLRYRIPVQGGFRVEVPRKGPDKTKPGVWWGEIIVQLEDYPATIEVAPIVAQWLVATWQDDKVQNGLPAEVQAWANVFDAEMDRVEKALNAKPESKATADEPLAK